jgi:peptidyl-tRNA hydrolase, PTH1 family
MALFQKRTDVSASQQLYTYGLKNTTLVIGLGNVGKKYSGTRHNIGFDCLDHFATNNEAPSWQTKKDLMCETTSFRLADTQVILAKPLTMMNNSGHAASLIAGFFKVAHPNIVAVYDELAIPFGTIRTRLGGGSAGHNGVKSLISHLSEDFMRIRVGIGPLPDDSEAADFVLKKFTKAQVGHISELHREVTALITETVIQGQINSETRSFILQH